MALTRGTRLGPYEIVAALGAGGMGEVYRATDTKLKRQIAIKILPAALAADPDRLARFQREAEVLASLNHPHIAAIYGLEEADGVKALVMELVEGPTLADRIAQGPIAIDEALPMAQQIAQALEAAHAQGIVHRDLKPANIKVRPDGTVKVLDFGLAKALAPDLLSAPAGEVSQSPTITTPAATRAGVIMGTAAYMSPEQARGKPIDTRTDIWAFGCVLYEMLTGQRAFAGDDVSDVLASVLAREPDVAALPATTPPPVRRLLRRCLHKDRGERLRDIGDARIEIREALTAPDAEVPIVPAPGPARRGRERLAWIGALTTLMLALAVMVAVALRPSPVPPEMRVDIVTPPTVSPLSLAISPDGRTLAFVATSEGQSRLWLRSLQSGEAKALAGTDGAESSFWSPDSRSLGFFAGGKLNRIDVDSGVVKVLANAPAGEHGAWNRNDVILFASLGFPIARVPATGGDPVALPRLAQQGSDFSPLFLPDGQHFLYYVRGSPDVRGVYISRLDGTMETRRLIDSDNIGVGYASSGHVLFIRQGTLLAQRFDLARLELTGNPEPVAEHVASNSPRAGVSVSEAGGAIAYRASANVQRQFAWFDRSGAEISKLGDSVSTPLSSPSLSRDGQHVVFYRAAGGNPDIWSLDTRRPVLSRVTSHLADDVGPVLSPDGDSIVFGSNRTGVHDLYRKSMASSGSDELLLATTQNKFATDWSLDGRFVLFNSQDPKKNGDIWALPLDGPGKPFPVVQTDFTEQAGQFSPDGHWIAYQSDESGRMQIYIQPFPGPGRKWPISTNGGTHVRWRRDGRELFYLTPDGRLVAVPIRVAANVQGPEVGTPLPLFAPRLGGLAQGDFRHQYMVSSDGQRFLIPTVTEEANPPITIILNWKPRS